MSLEDGYDEVLTTNLPRQVETQYRDALTTIKRRHKNVIDVYTSKEFRALKARLKQLVGEITANDIMDCNL